LIYPDGEENMKLLSRTLPVVTAAICLRMGSPFSASAATNYVAYGGPTTADYNFRPSNLSINVRDTVIWTNAGGVHSVTGLNTNEPLCGMTDGVSGCTNTFNLSGVFAYECNIHFGAPFYMTGVVNVAGAPLSPAILTNAVWTNGMFVFKVLSAANQTNIVQAATNLPAANWVSLDTNAPATNNFIFSDTNANQFPLRFYRVVNP
jgi:plastocyanin